MLAAQKGIFLGGVGAPEMLLFNKGPLTTVLGSKGTLLVRSLVSLDAQIAGPTLAI